MLLADHGATASVAASLKVFMPGLGQPATNRLLAAGVRPSLSVDVETAVSGDMFGVMRSALAYQQLVQAGASGVMVAGQILKSGGRVAGSDTIAAEAAASGHPHH